MPVRNNKKQTKSKLTSSEAETSQKIRSFKPSDNKPVETKPVVPVKTVKKQKIEGIEEIPEDVREAIQNIIDRRVAKRVNEEMAILQEDVRKKLTE